MILNISVRCCSTEWRLKTVTPIPTNRMHFHPRSQPPFSCKGAVPKQAMPCCQVRSLCKQEPLCTFQSEREFKVFDATLLSAILYGMGSWLSLSAVEIARPLYAQCVRIIVGVKKTTAADLCLVEAGMPTLIQRASESQMKALQKLLRNRALWQTIPLCTFFS